MVTRPECSRSHARPRVGQDGDEILWAVERPSEPVAEIAVFADGSRKFKGFRLDGEMHGEWSWHRMDGSLMRTGRFDRGTQVGVWRTYDRAGHLVKETDFSKG